MNNVNINISENLYRLLHNSNEEIVRRVLLETIRDTIKYNLIEHKSPFSLHDGEGKDEFERGVFAAISQIEWAIKVINGQY